MIESIIFVRIKDWFWLIDSRRAVQQQSNLLHPGLKKYEKRMSETINEPIKEEVSIVEVTPI